MGVSRSSSCEDGRMGEQREVLSWEDFGWAARQLAAEVWDSGFRPEMIVSVARGGLIPAGAVAYALDLKSMFVLNVEYYTGVGTTLSSPRLIDPVPEPHVLNGKRVLIVDDVADSGRTLQFVQEFCSQHAAEVRSAALFQKPRSVIDCDYVWKETDRWIAFPWSSLPPVNEEPTPCQRKDNL